MADLQYVFLTTGSEWIVPDDWNDDENTIIIIGGGGGGGGSNGGTNASTGGGGGGARVEGENVSFSIGESISFSVGGPGIGGNASTVDGFPSTDGGDTWFISASLFKAKGGKACPNLTETGGLGGAAADSIGPLKFSGGDGGDGLASGFPGSGGGGSAGRRDGDGYPGGDGGSFSGGGGGGAGGAGGNGDDYPSYGLPGPDGGGTGGGWDADRIAATSGTTSAEGFVGGGGGGVSGETSNDGGDGGAYGGGGAGCNANDAPGATFGASGGNGGSGAIIIIYRPFTIIKYIADAIEAGKPGQLFHLIEVDASEVGVPGDETPISFEYVYGIGSTPIDALELDADIGVPTRTFSFSDQGYRALDSDSDGPLVAPARLMPSISLVRKLNLSPTDISAGFSWGSASLARNNSDFDVSGTFEGLNYYSTDGVPARLYMGWKSYDAARGIYVDPEVGDLQRLFSGTAQEMSIGRDQITIPLRDPMLLLDRPLQRRLYGGSGGYDGDPAISGTAIPKARGGTSSFPIRNVRPVLIDRVNRIYQYNDGPGTVEALYEGAYAGFIDQGDTTDLYAGSTDDGKYRTDNSRGLFQLGSVAVAEITCDVTGEFPNAGSVTSAIRIALYLILEDLGISTNFVNGSEFTKVQGNFDYLGGVYFDPDVNWTGTQAVAFVLQSVYAKIAADQRGLLRPFVVQAYTGDQYATYDDDIISISPDAIPDEFSPVAYRFRVRFSKNWRVQQSGFVASATPEQQQFAAGGGPVSSWSDSLQALRFPNSKDTAILETALLEEADAQEVADRLGALWGTPRRAYAVELPLYGLQSDLGACIKLSYDIGLRPTPTYGYQYGVSYQPGSGKCTIYVVI